MTTSVQSIGAGAWVLVAVPAVVVTPTAPAESPVTIQIESYELRAPSHRVVEEDVLALRYAEAAEEDRTLAAEGCVTWGKSLGLEDREG